MQIVANEAGRIIDIGEPWYVAPDDGCWRRCFDIDAAAISVKGMLYRMPGTEPDTDAMPAGDWAWNDPDDHSAGIQIAYVYERDGDGLMLAMLDTIDVHSAEIGEAETALAEVYEGQAGISEQTTETQSALAEIYEGQTALADQITEIQTALAEQFEQVNGGGN